MIEAKKILAGKVEADAPVRQKAEQVFRFVMREIRNSAEPRPTRCSTHHP